MKSSLITAVALSLASVSSFAGFEQNVEYSTAEYCAIENMYPSSVSHQQYVKAYAGKLGYIPARSTCQVERELQSVANTNEKKSWNYNFNRPYKGSIIRLSNRQVELLRSASKEQKEALFTSID